MRRLLLRSIGSLILILTPAEDLDLEATRASLQLAMGLGHVFYNRTQTIDTLAKSARQFLLNRSQLRQICTTHMTSQS